MANPILEVVRTDPSRTRIASSDLGPLADGDVRVRIERFALTANNITYAVAGDLLGYWDFYPTDDEWGRIPAMGWGEVVESNVAGVDVGGRYYGWFPMGAYIDITATPTADGLRDDGAHRTAHAPVYRSLTRTDADNLHQPGIDAEDRHALLRGLFLTGFLAEAFFGADEYLGAEQVVVLSASSKTAIGFAQRAKKRGTVAVVGVTSPGNVDFVRATGFYDEVRTYDDVGEIAVCPSVIVDMAGNGAVLAELHRVLADDIAYSMMIGRSHHDAPPAAPTAGPKPEFFFAPTEVTRRLEEWGRASYEEQTREALFAFVDGSRAWLDVEHRVGESGALSAYADVHAGAVPPSVGVVVSLHE